MKKIIHVNKHVIAANGKHGRNDPPLSVKTYKANDKCHEAVVTLDGIEVGRFVHRPDKPLSCGAKVWFELNERAKVVARTDSGDITL